MQANGPFDGDARRLKGTDGRQQVKGLSGSVKQRKTPAGIEADKHLTSRVFPGLYLAVDALLAGDMETVIAELHTGLQTEAHAQFVTYLQQTE